MPPIEGASGTAFVATNSDREEYVLLVWKKSSAAFRRDDASAFIRGMNSTLPRGWTAVDAKASDSSIPFAKSAKFTTTLRLPDGSEAYQHAYLAPGRSTFIFMCYSLSAAEPESFTSFVQSFRVINVRQNLYDPIERIVGQPLMWVYFITLFIVAGVCGAINRVSQSTLNSFKIAGWAVGALFATTIVLLVWYFGRANVDDPGFQGELFGRLLGAGTIPLVVATFLANRSARRQRQMHTVSGPPAA